jgi:CRP-like cAMP-binding protein
LLVERVWQQAEQQLIARQFRTAGERYAELLQHSPHLLQRVALGHIASYLGITQVTLSRASQAPISAVASGRGKLQAWPA